MTRCVTSAASPLSSTNDDPPSSQPKASNPVRFGRRHRKVRQPRATKAEESKIRQPLATNAEEKRLTGKKAAPRKNDRDRVSKRAPTRKSNAKQYTSQQQAPETMFTSCSWVQINNIPVLSTLEDVVRSVEEVLEFEKERGIIDLDANDWEKGESLPLLDLPEEGHEWVLSAKLVLSTYYRPSGWRLEFDNRSIAHALLQHTKHTSSLKCAWKPVTVEEWNQDLGNVQTEQEKQQQKISDASIRIENCTEKTTVDHLRHVLRRYDLTTEPNSIQKLSRSRNDIFFLVHFANASWARAAVRELQGVVVNKNELRFCQYPKQIP